MTASIPGFEMREFTDRGTTRAVFRIGEGPGVVLMHEMPGITPEAIALARRLADAGYTVDLPHLFGAIGRPMTRGYWTAQLMRLCVRREFSLLASGRSSAIVEWLKALCRDLHADVGGPGVGAIGMCVTGNFALAMLVEPILMAPVLSQPSLPVAFTRTGRRGLHCSRRDLDQVKRRVDTEGVRVLGLRFTGDRLCPAERFARLSDELGDGFVSIEIDSSAENTHGIDRRAHSVLTLDFVDRKGHPTRAALDRVLSFLAERLKPPERVDLRDPSRG